MNINKVLKRPEYEFIRTNPHLGGQCYLQHSVEVIRMERMWKDQISMCADVR